MPINSRSWGHTRVTHVLCLMYCMGSVYQSFIKLRLVGFEQNVARDKTLQLEGYPELFAMHDS